MRVASDQHRKIESKASKYKASMAAMETKLEKSRKEKQTALAKFLAAKEKLRTVQVIKSGAADAGKRAEREAMEREKRMKAAREKARMSMERAKAKELKIAILKFHEETVQQQRRKCSPAAGYREALPRKSGDYVARAAVE